MAAKFAVATDELVCPTCNADILTSGDEEIGDEVFCMTCGAPCKIEATDDGAELVEDY